LAGESAQMPGTFPNAANPAAIVGRAILPAAAFQAALSGYERTLERGKRRLKAAQRAPRSQDWLPHTHYYWIRSPYSRSSSLAGRYTRTKYSPAPSPWTWTPSRARVSIPCRTVWPV
jgi:hypothetical protein